MRRLIRRGALVLVAILLYTAGPVTSQPAKRMDLVRLSRLSAELRKDFGTSRLAAESLAVRWGIPRIRVDTSWSVRELIGIRNGRPVFYQTHNRAAALSIGTTALQAGGRSGLELTGSGLTLGIWDAGGIRLDHVEFGGRVSQADTPFQFLNHSTHVAGTMIASGVLGSVRGMATQALLRAYDWNNDGAEMAAAAAEGLVLSNHSYGSPAGWVENLKGDGLWGWLGDPALGTLEDQRFGHYDGIARMWDEITSAAPEYLIVKSAGNERADRGPSPGTPHYVFDSDWRVSTVERPWDGGLTGFGTILDGGISKNVLTVGAVEDLPWGYSAPEDVVMTDFSGWGPTNDGRIKPDLVANGVQLLSSLAWARDAYGTSSGSSMATPSVSGTAGLLQGLYQTIHNGNPPLSSTMRALLIHTANEAGPAPGPDFRFGWGLLDAERAAAIILNGDRVDGGQVDRARSGMIAETVLDQDSTYEISIHFEPGDPIRVTLAWTDPPADVKLASQDNRSTLLINDLDLEVSGPDGILLPWTLDPANPEVPARAGVNAVDNVEQVFLELAIGGDYIIRVQHAGNLDSGSQLISLVIGEPEIERSGSSNLTVSGTVRLSGFGMNRVLVRLAGPITATAETTPDGTYTFSGIPPGTYTITAFSDLLSFLDPVREVILTTRDRRLDFEAVSPLLFEGFSLFDSPNLLQSNELDGARYSTTLSAGGVYGCTLSFTSTSLDELAGGRVAMDWSFDTRVAPFIGEKADQFLELSDDWVMKKSGAGRMHKRIPALWIDPASPVGYTARIPFRVYAGDESLVLADTLAIYVDRTDDVAPGIFPIITAEGRGHVQPGGQLGINVAILDGSPVASVWAHMLDRDDPSIALVSFQLFDSGNLESDQDIVRGDGLFSGVFVPTQSREYRLSLEVEDISGNRAFRNTDVHYSATSFTRASEVLLLARNERASATNLHRSILSEIQVPHEFWEFTVRGQIPRDLLNSYPIVVWTLHNSPLDRKEDQNQLLSYLDSGGHLLLLGEQLVTETVDRDWLDDELGILSLGRAATGGTASGFSSQRAFEGFREDLAEESRAGLFRPQGVAMPVLSLLDQAGTESGVIGLQVEHDTGKMIVAGISLASLAGSTAGTELMRRFLFGLSDDSRFLPDPDAVQLLTPADGKSDTSTDLDFDWSVAAMMSYRFQLSDNNDFGGTLLADTTVASPPIRIQNLAYGASFYWRLRAENLKGVGAWSAAYSFRTEKQNEIPFVASPIGDQLLEEGGPESLISLTGIFSDPDGDSLTYSTSSSDTTVVRSGIRGDNLVLTPVGPGNSVIEIRAEDIAGESASVQLVVTVSANTSPSVTDTFEDILIILSEGPRVWNLYGAFDDADGDGLSYAASSSDPSVVQVRIEAGQAIATAVAAGSAIITFVADDGRTGVSQISFIVTVRSNSPPSLERTMSNLEILIAGDSTHIDLVDFLSDPDEDPVSYVVLSDPEGVVETRIRGSVLSIVPRSPGQTTISVSATDNYGASTTASFEVSIRTQAALSRIDTEAPARFSLRQNYPNPLRARTTFVFEIPEAGRARLSIYSILGNEAAVLFSGPLEPGIYSLDWAPRNLASGVYAFRLVAGTFTATRLMSIVR